MAKVISITNFKGGVGKTTSTVNLGGAIARQGKKTMLIDLDPQHNLSEHLNVSQEDSNLWKLLYDIRCKETLYMEEVVDNLFVVPSSWELVTADVEMASIMAGRELRLKKALEPFMDSFDYIIIDCPPSLGILPHNAYFASDLILVPIETEVLPLKGFRMLSDALSSIDRRIDGVFMTKHDKRKRMHKDIAIIIEDGLTDIVFNTKIRHNVALAEAPSSYQTIFDYDDSSYGAEDYTKLCKEFLAKYDCVSH